MPGFPDDPRIIDSTGALELPEDCKRLLVIGGGIIGLEMACVYDALGATVTVVELSRRADAGHRSRSGAAAAKADREALCAHHAQYARRRSSRRTPEGLRATFEGPDAPAPQDFDRVLVAVGRSANGNAIDAAAAGVAVDKRGIIAVDKQMRTNVPHIFAIGDIAGRADARPQGHS